jgi:hypothetical protein
MRSSADASKDLSPEQERIVRVHWKWANRHATFWIIISVLIFGGMFAVFDFVGADESTRTQSFILLAVVTLVNAVWRAVGALAARVELIMRSEDSQKLT